MKSLSVHIGCSGWNYKDWQGKFYGKNTSPREWFAEYSRKFSTVEVNNTFYRLADKSVFRKWKHWAPPGFIYSVKGSRYITHMKKLKDPGEGLDNFMKRADVLEDHLGPVLFQLPPNFNINCDRLESFLKMLPCGHKYVMEFRNRTWYDEDVYKLLSEKGVSLCLHDMKGSEILDKRVGPLLYIRLHGTGVKYSGSYKKRSLRKYVSIIKKEKEQSGKVYVYFNNDFNANAPHDALTLKDMLENR